MKKLITSLLRSKNLYLTRGLSVPMTIRQMDNFSYYERMYQRIQGIEGALVECGIGKGRSYLYLNYLAQKEAKGRMVWGFDSFEGFPEPTEHDASARNPKKGEWSGFSIPDMQNILCTAGFSKEWIEGNTRLVQGFFSDTMNKYDGKPIAFLHIDSDLYESYKDPLESLFPQVVPGGLVLFDEYNRPNWPGATKAVDEFFASTPYQVQHDERADKYFVVK